MKIRLSLFVRITAYFFRQQTACLGVCGQRSRLRCNQVWNVLFLRNLDCRWCYCCLTALAAGWNLLLSEAMWYRWLCLMWSSNFGWCAHTRPDWTILTWDIFDMGVGFSYPSKVRWTLQLRKSLDGDGHRQRMVLSSAGTFGLLLFHVFLFCRSAGPDLQRSFFKDRRNRLKLASHLHWTTSFVFILKGEQMLSVGNKLTSGLFVVVLARILGGTRIPWFYSHTHFVFFLMASPILSSFHAQVIVAMRQRLNETHLCGVNACFLVIHNCETSIVNFKLVISWNLCPNYYCEIMQAYTTQTFHPIWELSGVYTDRHLRSI